MTVAAETASLREDVRGVAWWLLVGAGSGAIAGLVVGGIGGRLAMLLLRLTSPDAVIGAISDDEFEIGIVTTRTFGLLFGMAFLGAVNGVLYATLRGAIPSRLRLPIWALLGAAAGGARIVHEDGVDFTLLEPVALAVLLFVALPGLAAALVVVLVERWIVRDPAEDRRLVRGLVVAAAVGTFALVAAAVIGALALGLRRQGDAAERIRPIARIAIPVALVGITVAAAFNLVSEASRLI